MPDAPASNPITHSILENPWPIAGVLLATALVLGFIGLREGLRNRVRLAGLLGSIGAGIIIVGTLITTAGEHGKVIAKQLVQAAVSKDIVGGIALFSDNATMNAGSPQNPGFDREFIQSQFARLAERYTIESNSIAVLRGATLSRDEAEVRLACLTTVAEFPYPNTSQWILRVQRMPDGTWKITRLTCVAINDNTPPLERIW